MAAAGHQAEAALDEIIEQYKGNYILAVEGNPPLNRTACSASSAASPSSSSCKSGRGLQGDHLLGGLRLLGLRAGGATRTRRGHAGP
jgi:hypothetical protein